MNQRQAGNVLRRNAPQGEHPAYINNQEASWLKGMGGSGRPTKSGLRSYYRGGDKEYTIGGSGEFSTDNVQPFMEERWGKWGTGDKAAHDAQMKDQADRMIAAEAGGSSGGSGGSGGSGIQTRQNTNTSVSEIDRPTHEFRQDIYDRARDVMDTPYTKYGGERFADPSADTLTAQTGVRDMQGVGQGAYTSAGQTATGVQGTTIDPITGQSFLTGRGVDEYMSPHTANVIKGMQDNAMRTMQMQRNQLGADAQMAGAGMGSRSAIEKAVMAGEVQRDLGQRVAGALEGSYAQAAGMKEGDMTREQQRQRYNQLSQTEEGRLRLAGAETGIRATDAGRKAGYEDVTMLSRVGADIEGRDQNIKDFDYDQYIEGRDWDRGNVMLGSNVLSGAPVGTTTTQNTPQYRNQNVDRWGRAIAGAGAGWLAGGPYGALAGGAMGYFG